MLLLLVSDIAFAQSTDLDALRRMEPSISQSNPVEGNVNVPNLGYLPGLPAVQRVNSPVLTEQRGTFEAINETTYVVGPGDYLHITVASQVINVAISPEGYIILEDVPPVFVNGSTLLKARKALVKAASGYYKTEAMQVRLAQAKKFQVVIAGAVNAPGIYSVEPGARVTNILEAARGFSVRSSREISITRANGEVLNVDLKGFYLNASIADNPTLRQGDRIVVHDLKHDGQIVYVREGTNLLSMQHRNGETLNDFVLRYDGYRNTREWRYARVYDASGELVETVLRDKARDFSPQPGTTLELHAPKSMIFVGGMVVRPGYFDYNPSLSPMDYLALAGVTVNTADVRRIEIYDAQGRKRANSAGRAHLSPGDHILVPRSYEATLRDHIGLISAVSSLAVAIATFAVLTSN